MPQDLKGAFLPLAATVRLVIAFSELNAGPDMDDDLNLAELDDVDLHLLFMAATLLFPNTLEDRAFRQITEEAQRRGWPRAPDEAAVAL